MNDISPREVFERAMRRWWLVAVCAIAGGLAGLLFASARAPVYETSATLAVAFDADRAPEFDFRDIEATKQAAMDIIFSPAVRVHLLEQAQAGDFILSAEAFDDGSFTIQRLNNRWLLTVRSANPRDSATLANAWGEAAASALAEAYGHALAVENIERRLTTLRLCSANPALAAVNSCAGTNFADRAELDSSVADLTTQLIAERQAAHGLVAALTLMPGRAAPLPQQPVYFGRNPLALAGIFLGFLLGAGLALLLPLSGKKGS
jgi:capsular polysaccharide biosynthesis protein